MSKISEALTRGHIATTDVRFNRIHQVVLTCPPVRARWRHLANTIELVLPSAHPSPQPKWQIYRFRRFCIAYGTVSSCMPMHVLSPNNCSFARGSWPQVIHASLGPSESTTPTASWLVQPFLHSSRQSVIRHVRACPSPSKLPIHTVICTPI